MGIEYDPMQRGDVRKEPSISVRLRVYIDDNLIMRHMVYYFEGHAHPRFLPVPILCPDGERTLDILYDMALSKPKDNDGNRVLFDGDPYEYQRRFLDVYSPPGQSIIFFGGQQQCLSLQIRYQDEEED